MPYPIRVWQLVLMLSIVLSTSRNAVSQGACISLITNNGNAKFSASTSALGPGYPVLHGNDVWCAGVINEDQYLKIDLGLNLLLDRVSVQGMSNTQRSVSQYDLEVSTDNITFNEVLSPQTFFGPLFDGNTVVSTNLTTPVRARWVIFNPEEPLIQNENHLCMRVDIQSCQNVPAPVNGGMSIWTQWSQCQCNTYTRTRTRTCTNPAPAFGGLPCSAHKAEDQFCNLNCPIVHGGWSAWGIWSSCSATCGSGTRLRIRLCNNPPPSNGGVYCVGPAIDNGACLDQICTTTPAPTTTRLPETTTNPTTTQLPATTTNPTTTQLPETTTSPTTTQLPETTSPNTTPSPDTTATPGTTASPGTTAAPDTTTQPATTTAPPTTAPAPTTGVSGNNIPYLDLVFAISATSNNSAQTYAAMTNTIKQFIDKYGGADKIHVSILVYGNQVTRVVSFNHTFPPSANQLKAAIDAQAALSGGPVLTNALHEAFSVFNETMGRPNATKVLVVMTDKNSAAVNDPGTPMMQNTVMNNNNLDAAVRPLEDSDVLVISVAVGTVNRSELLVISPNPLDVISVDENVDNSELAERIMERILRKIPEIDVGFAITATSISSRVIYNVMLESINTINERYRGYDVRFSILIYGSKNTTKLRDFANTIDSHEGLITSVNELAESPGIINLKKKLEEAERLFRSGGRPFSRKVFVVLTDTGNDNEIITAGDVLRRHGIILLSASRTGDQLNSVTITHIDYLSTPTITTDRPVVIAETIIYKALQVNIPEIDLTFALSATSVESDTSYTLMQTTVNSIIQQYGIGRIHYTVIVFGSVVTRAFDFDSSIPDQDDLMRRVLRLPKKDGSPDLANALEDVNRVYQLRGVRPNARRILVVIMDNATVSSREDLTKAVYTLVNNSVFIIGVGVGSSINPTDLAIITREVRHTIIVGTNKAPTELAEEIIDIILLGIRTAGFSLWGSWSACSQTCRSFGVAGTETRSRFCINPKLGCEGPTVETRECNGQNCQGCQERILPSDSSYQASTAVQPARFAKLNTSNPRESVVAWCRNPDDVNGFIQLDLGEQVLVTRVATKGQEAQSAEHWVTSYYITLSPDGLSYSDYTEGGQRKDFPGNTDPTTVVFNDLNTTDSVRYVRFHPISSQEQPCMQASVFGCTASIAPVDNPFSADSKAGKGILIALWILAGILTFLLLMACCYYCCWHVCCGRGKKRKGITHRILVEDDVDKRWILMPTGMAKPVAESEIQEVVVEIGEEKAKPSGVIQFGIEAEESKESHVTAETVHSELPVYSDEVATINSNASSITMDSKDPRYSSVRKRIKSESAASVQGETTSTSSKGSIRKKAQKGSGFGNGGFERSYEWLADPFELPQVNDGRNGVTRSQSLDELAIVDYDMFEERRGAAQSAELGPDGYMRMKETSRESVNMPNGGLNHPQGSQQPYGMKEQELVFMAENGGQNVHMLEKWINTDGDADPRQSSAANEPVYSEVGSQISNNESIYSEVGSQIPKDESIYSEVGSQISRE